MRNLPNTSVAYLTILNKQYSPGVYKKILGTLNGAKENGFEVRLWCQSPEGDFVKSLKQEIIQAPEKILIIRSLCEYNIYLLPSLLKARKEGKIIILDVPTPNRVAVNEIFKGEKSFMGKGKSLSLLILSGSIPYLFSHRVIQYAKEGWWFRLGVNHKTKFMGNGIDVDSIPMRSKKPHWPSATLNFIAVASLNYWHGLDRFMHAMSVFNAQSRPYKIQLEIVGKGAAYNTLVNLSQDLGIREYVNFKGFLEGEELYSRYESNHIGLGSLALYRKKLKEASELKAREYASIGIPFISTGNDPDFPKESVFRYEISNEDNISSIVDFFNEAPEFISHTERLDIRKYAKENLDYKVKFLQIVEGLI